jgi:hypothetical protein
VFLALHAAITSIACTCGEAACTDRAALVQGTRSTFSAAATVSAAEIELDDDMTG